MTFPRYNWQERPWQGGDSATAMQRCLANRGITCPDAARDFLAPRLANCADPAAMRGVPEAAELICGFVARNEKIVIFSDYDADGITGATIMSKTLSLVGADVAEFLPCRAEEGYGFTEKALARCLATHPAAKLLVTVDCGVSQNAAAANAVAAGLTVVVTDHHEQTGPLPAAAAIVVLPYAEGNPEAVHKLCGAGVAYKLAHQILRFAQGWKNGGFLRAITREEALAALHSLLPIVALGTVADFVPLTCENRMLAGEDVEEFNRPKHGRNTGLEAVRKASNFSGAARSVDFGFVFGPRINASGRIADPAQSLRLLLTDSHAEATQIANILEENNTDRRMLEAEAFKTALGDKDARRGFSVVYHNVEMRAGVAGLVASRLAERHNLPAVALCNENILKGSARCPDIDGVHLTELLGECSALLENFGGHKAAAGLSVKAENYEAFRAAFDAACARALAGKDTRPRVNIDSWISPSDVTLRFKDEMESLQPFGEGNPAPLFAVAGAVLKNTPRKFGKTTTNWELSFEGFACNAVLYRCEEFPFAKGDALDIVFSLSQTQYDKLVLDVRDVRTK